MSAALESLMQDVPAPRRLKLPFQDLLAFLCVGASGAIGFVLLSSAVIWLGTGLEAWVTNTACYATTILPVYLMHRRFSFRSNAPHAQALPRYLAVQGMALMLAAIFSYLVHDMLQVATLPASMLVIALTSGVNFLVLRSWAFARERLHIPVPA